MNATVTPLPTRAQAKLIRSQAMFDQRISSARSEDAKWQAILGELRAVYASATEQERALMAVQVRDVSRTQRARAGSRARRGRVRAA